jgi:hypothetical protein
MFQLEVQEFESLRSQFATSHGAKGGRRYRPYLFTEHDAVMAANVLSSQVAIHASIIVVRTFILMRTMFAEHRELKQRLQEIERRLDRCGLASTSVAKNREIYSIQWVGPCLEAEAGCFSESLIRIMT